MKHLLFIPIILSLFGSPQSVQASTEDLEQDVQALCRYVGIHAFMFISMRQMGFSKQDVTMGYINTSLETEMIILDVIDNAFLEPIESDKIYKNLAIRSFVNNYEIACEKVFSNID